MESTRVHNTATQMPSSLGPGWALCPLGPPIPQAQEKAVWPVTCAWPVAVMVSDLPLGHLSLLEDQLTLAGGQLRCIIWLLPGPGSPFLSFYL